MTADIRTKEDVMTKRITAVLLVFAVLLLSGCNNNRRLTPEEYRDELQSCIKDYASVLTKIGLDDIQAFDKSGTEPSEFEEHCKDFEKAIKNIEKINPPAELVYKHGLLLEAFDIEREWLEAVRELMSTKTPEEKEKALKKIQTVASSENTFMIRYVEILKELPKDTSG